MGSNSDDSVKYFLSWHFAGNTTDTAGDGELEDTSLV